MSLDFVMELRRVTIQSFSVTSQPNHCINQCYLIQISKDTDSNGMAFSYFMIGMDLHDPVRRIFFLHQKS